MPKEREQLTKTWKNIEMASRAADLVWGGGQNAQEAASQLGVSRNHLFESLGVARSLGLLQARTDLHRYINPVRSEPLAEKVVKAFGDFGLEHAVVLELPRQLSCYRGYGAALDRSLHVLLGQSSVRHLEELDKPINNIGVGGGRAVTSFIREVVDHDIKFSSTCQVSSLAGGVVWPYFEDSECLLAPADLVALELRGQLGQRGVKYEAPSLALSPPLVAEGLEHMAKPNPEVAIFGIGTVSRNMNHLLISDDFLISIPSDEIKGHLLELKKNLSSEIWGMDDLVSSGHYYPLMEVLNTLAVIKPPDSPSLRVSEKILENLDQTVKNLNHYSNGLSWEKLKEVPVRIAIAGGLHKTFQIWSVLKEHLVSHLVTDALTCEALLRLARK